MDFAELGKRVKQARKEKGYTQKELGEKTGYSEPHISHVEGGAIPSLEFAAKLAKALEISLDELVYGSLQFRGTDMEAEDAMWETCTRKEKKFVIEVLRVYRDNMRVNMDIGID